MRITIGIIVLAIVLAAPASAGLIADWGEGFGDEGLSGVNSQQITAVDYDGAGNIYVAGSFRGNINLGGSTLFAQPNNVNDFFLAKFTSTGQHIWSVRGGGSGNEWVHDIDVEPSGAVALVGFTASPTFIVFGDSTATNGQNDAFLVNYSSAGVYGWSEVWGGAFNDEATSVAWRTGTNSIIVSGLFVGSVDFGPGALHTAVGGRDFFLLDVKVWGVTAFAATVGSTGDEKWTSILIDSNDDIIFAGTFENTINMGNGPLVSIGAQSACLARIPAVGSAATWSQGFGGTTAGDACWASSITTDGASFYMTGSLRGSANLGTGSLTSAGETDVYVAAYKSTGTPTWSVRGGSTTGDGGSHIDYYNGQLSVAGFITGAGTFGPYQLQPIGNFDALLLVYDTAGNIDRAKIGGSEFVDIAYQAAINQDGICMVGSFRSTANFDAVQLVNVVATAEDGFVVRYVENSSVGVNDAIIPAFTGLDLSAPRPNPLRESTVIEYLSDVPGGVREASVYDITGRLQRRLSVADSGPSGRLHWDGRNSRGVPVPAGIYFIRATDGNSTTNRRVTVIR